MHRQDVRVLEHLHRYLAAVPQVLRQVPSPCPAPELALEDIAVTESIGQRVLD
jgi:hypothetical protein